MKSLQWRVSVGLAVSLTLAFVVQWFVTQVTVQELLKDMVEHELVEDTEELFQALHWQDRQGARTPALHHVDPEFGSSDSDHYFEILVDGQRALASPSLGTGHLHTAVLKPEQASAGLLQGPKGERVLFGSRGFAKDGHEVTIRIAMGMQRVEEKADRVLVRVGIVSALTGVLLVLLQHWIVYRHLRVFARVRREAKDVSNGALERLDENVPSEVVPLVNEINGMFAAMTQRLARSRQALGNLAHALKTPLSLATQSAQEQQAVLAAMGGPTTATGQDVFDHLGALRRRIDFELKRARLAGPCSMGAEFDLRHDIEVIVSAMDKLHSRKPLHIRCDMPASLRLRADREDMLELVGNLIDNACKHASGRVLVRVGIGTDLPDKLQLIVDDDGPGSDETSRDRLIERGTRGSEQGEGSGLGLSIVSEIVESYGGTLELAKSDLLHGFRAQVSLPSSLVVASPP